MRRIAHSDAVNGKYFLQINRILNHIAYKKLKNFAFNRTTVCLAGWLSISHTLLWEEETNGKQRRMHSKNNNNNKKNRAHKMRMEIKISQMILLNTFDVAFYAKKEPSCLMPEWFTLYSCDYSIDMMIFSRPPFHISLRLRSWYICTLYLNWFFSFNWLKIHWTGFNVIGFDFI